jgi:hypothetical protein
MRIAAVFMTKSMPCRAGRVKVPAQGGTHYLQLCMKRVSGKGVRALFTPTRDNKARLKPVRSSMRRAYAMLGLGTVMFFAAASLALLPNGTQASSTEATFLVPATDGYGVAECLIANRACGQVVADTWCEAQGYAKAVSFRQTTPEEVTGSIQKTSLAPKESPIAITCAN